MFIQSHLIMKKDVHICMVWADLQNFTVQITCARARAQAAVSLGPQPPR